MAEQVDSDEETPQLSAHALAALQEFYTEHLVQEQQIAARKETGGGPVEIEEDWQLSQFWYDDSTAVTLAEEALRASQNKRIACISCPTLFSKLLELKPPECVAFLLEYDHRFDIYGEHFIFYDYKKPLNLPGALQEHSFDLVVADPPFLSEECLHQTAQTVKYLTKDKILLCTGAVMKDSAYQFLGVSPCDFIPRHTRNLANEFRCYVNYESGLNGIHHNKDKS